MKEILFSIKCDQNNKYHICLIIATITGCLKCCSNLLLNIARTKRGSTRKCMSVREWDPLHNSHPLQLGITCSWRPFIAKFTHIIWKFQLSYFNLSQNMKKQIISFWTKKYTGRENNYVHTSECVCICTP